MNNERIEYTILRNLIFNEDYTRKVLPFINEIFFPKREEQILFQEINTFVMKYKNLPSKESILIEESDSGEIDVEAIKLISGCLLPLSCNSLVFRRGPRALCQEPCGLQNRSKKH